MREYIEEEFNNHLKALDAVKSKFHTLEKISQVAINVLQDNKKIIIFGNGGSAADAQHIAAELSGRYKRDRLGLAAISLTTDSSALTAIANDFGFSSIFQRQVEAIANSGDLIIGISTSGNSQNVLKAIQFANKMNCKTVSFTGFDGGEISKESDINFNVDVSDTPRVQEMHILAGHIICELIDRFHNTLIK